MKNILLIVFSLALLPLSAREDNKITPAEELMKLMAFEESVIQSGEAGFGMVEQSLAGQDLNKEEMEEVKDAFMAYMRQVATDPELKAKTTSAYEKNFTIEEIKELIAFYKTPVGKKSIKVLPALTGEIMAFSQQLAQRHVGSFQETLGKILERRAAREKKENE